MKWDEIHDFLDAIGIPESEIDGVFLAILAPNYPMEGAEGYKLCIDHTYIKAPSMKLIVDEAESRGKNVTKKIIEVREMTVIYTPEGQ